MARVLVLGATGYVGGRLVPHLVADGHDVRCMVRATAKVRLPADCGGVRIVSGDVFDEDSVRRAVEGIDVVYYLVHSLAERDFQYLDLTAATTVALAARQAGVRRIVYLGGLRPAEDGPAASRHLASRAEVGDVFLAAEVPAVVLQASVIVGSGSTSYELLRYLTERTPVMPLPSWVDNRTQPIAIGDVLHYLVGCATVGAEVNRAFDIGGPDVLTYREMIQRYAQAAGLSPRLMLPSPVWSNGLLAKVIERITPVSAAVAEPLLESMAHELVCTERDVAEHVPDPPTGLMTFEQAVRAAMVRSLPGASAVRDAGAPRRWAALPLPGDVPGSGGPAFVDERVFTSAASVERVWATVSAVGGDNGWYTLPMVWEIRGIVDRMVGGIGTRRGRSIQPKVGDVVDWWRVEAFDDEHHRLLLRAEMKTPGQTWLDLSVEPAEDGSTVYRQRMVFMPTGTRGHVYWLALRPMHDFLYDVMARNVVLVAQQEPTLFTPLASLLGPLARRLARAT